ncbi:MAG: CDP-alcohol phosphatidyltransferase family protein [Candidatus Bathyarchaeota archaeon]|nr:CDP-alcohol phosphatidyltransferase family protein [Candidatus Bathyarchaeota archaeon]
MGRPRVREGGDEGIDSERKIEKEKGASDLLAYYVHQPLENRIVGRLAHTSVTPNQLTLLTNAVAYCVTALFYLGHLLPASALSFGVGLMDGLDGKLARAKDMTSKLGKMEHALDLLYEFSWLAALVIYLNRSIGGPTPLVCGLLSVVLIAFYRYCYDIFGGAMGMSLDIHGPFEKVFRRVAGRRNLYNIHILVAILLGVPGYALVSITVHAAITAVVYAWRASVHLHAADMIEGR